MRVLLTGGAGYIGSHTAVNLISDGNKVLLYDNLSNSDASVINGIAAITGVKPTLIKGDVLDEIGLVNAIEKFKPDAVIHFAGLKSVKESSLKPSKQQNGHKAVWRVVLCTDYKMLSMSIL